MNLKTKENLKEIEERKAIIAKTIDLLKEVGEVMSVQSGGKNLIEDIYSNEDYSSIFIKYEFGEIDEYDFEDRYRFLEQYIEGYGPCSGSFYEDVELGISDTESNYKTMEKDEFINTIGKYYYMKYRVPEILEILRSL